MDFVGGVQEEDTFAHTFAISRGLSFGIDFVVASSELKEQQRKYIIWERSDCGDYIDGEMSTDTQDATLLVTITESLYGELSALFHYFNSHFHFVGKRIREF